MLMGMTGCEDNENSTGLKGTTWKLAGFVNVETGELTEAEPKGKGYYTFTFDTDTNAWGRSILNTIQVSLRPVPGIHTTTEIDDSMNGNATLFYDAIRSIESYTHEGDELKFFYADGQHYLLFRLVQP